MLTRIYADNYKCLVKFDLPLLPLQLIIGNNGTGKSSIIEVLSALRAFTTGVLSTSQAFSARSLTRWQTERYQQFELDVLKDNDAYRYTLQIEHDTDMKRSRVTREILEFNKKHLFEFIGGEVHLFRDNHSAGPVFPADWSRSALAVVPEGNENLKLTWFKKWVSNLSCLKIDPYNMTSRSEDEDDYPEERLHNFVSWYRRKSDERPDGMLKMYGALRDIFDGFLSLPLVSYGENAKQLNISQQMAGVPRAINCSFDEVSDGQRALIALYALFYLGLTSDSTICLDEPDNFISLSELQPMLLSLEERLSEEPGAQLLLISHNQTIIDSLAAEAGIVLYRDATGATRWRKFQAPPDTTLSAGELVARGWDE
jgi:ABC-type cobalamin/Fe3+-siderophores transport system ATPase subunit